MEDLLKCPFCGSHAETYSKGNRWQIACSNSSCFVRPSAPPEPTIGVGNIEIARDTWNSRNCEFEDSGWCKISAHECPDCLETDKEGCACERAL